MEILGYSATILIGLSLGLIGGGGSVLAVPLLVYLFNIDPVEAMGYSLFIVGVTSLAGSVLKLRQGLVSLRIAYMFGIPAIATVYITRALLVPRIPVQLFTIDGFVITRSMVMMILFALLMIVASISMIRKPNFSEGREIVSKTKYFFLFLEGSVVGLVTGLFGAGGGFLIIPALIFFNNLPVKRAVGTSLLIIAVNSLVGFIGDNSDYRVDWNFLLTITLLATVGLLAGVRLSQKIPGEKLKRIFGWFILVMGLYILGKELCCLRDNTIHTGLHQRRNKNSEAYVTKVIADVATEKEFYSSAITNTKYGINFFRIN